MKKNQQIIAVIPARYGSTRFPGKSLALIQGKPMIQWVYERTKRSQLVDRVLVATDDDRIMRTVSDFGGEAVMTSKDHPTGTDRIAEVARGLTCGIIVNVQGDEPLIEPAMIDEAIKPMVDDAAILMGTVCKRIDSREEAFDPNVVKVVLDEQGFALLFSRAPIPWDRDAWAGKRSLDELPLTASMYKHIGLYAYRREFLLNYANLPQTELEIVEKLEQLRVLGHGYRIRAVVTEYESFGVDIPEDLSKILNRLKERRA